MGLKKLSGSMTHWLLFAFSSHQIFIVFMNVC